MNEFAFIPSKEEFERSNIYRLMKRNDISTYTELLEKASEDQCWFWNSVSEDLDIVWHKKYDKVLDESHGKAWPKWFVNGKTNIYSSCIEKNLKLNPDKLAYIFISEDNTEQKITYRQVSIETDKFANALKSIGVAKGDVVAIYMPMIPEAIYAMLACAKIGAIQTTIFSGYSSDALKTRIQDCDAKILITSDGYNRKGKPISQQRAVNAAVKDSKIEKVVVVSYKKIDSYDENEQFVMYESLLGKNNHTAETIKMDSESPLFILYTSGTTGKPKGTVHVHGGFSVFAAHQAAYLIDLQQEDVLFWPADIGWITGLTWNVYGLLETGSTAVIYDGALDWPNHDRIWEIVSKYKVTIFGLSPTAIRIFKRQIENPSKSHDLGSIRIMPITGEPIDENSWWWLFERVGEKKCPIMNLVGGTEIGGAFLSVVPGMSIKPSTVGMPCPGMCLDVLDENGNSVRERKGYLVVTKTWPAITRGILKDNKRYLDTYWSKFSDVWFHGDFSLIDSNGLWYMLGRVDDVINVSGHRLSTAELEECLISNAKIIEAAVVSMPDEITGEAIYAFVVLGHNQQRYDGIEEDIKRYVGEKIGKIATPHSVRIVNELPKTRTGKILRRLLRDKLKGKPLGDLSSLENPSSLHNL